MSDRCDYCSGFGCIGECHDLPLPGAPIATVAPVAPIAPVAFSPLTTNVSADVTAANGWVAEAGASVNLAAEDRLAGRSNNQEEP